MVDFETFVNYLSHETTSPQRVLIQAALPSAEISFDGKNKVIHPFVVFTIGRNGDISVACVEQRETSLNDKILTESRVLSALEIGKELQERLGPKPIELSIAVPDAPGSVNDRSGLVPGIRMDRKYDVMALKRHLEENGAIPFRRSNAKIFPSLISL